MSVLQRLFSTFADGWPGVGLLLLRLLTAVALVHFGLDGVHAASSVTIVVPEIIGVGAGMLLLVGLWTPVAGALAAIVEVWIAASRFLAQSGDPWMPIIQALLGVILAMIGPGVWSIDARLFGRRRIAFPERVEFFSPDRGTTKSHDPANE